MPEARYVVLGLLGEGATGRVYRARLEAGGGYSRDVALKLLKDDSLPDEVLQRFRDEARILGLLRDRAFVAADPPAQLGGRWAVVMEYVDGLPLSELIDEEPVPPRVGLEIVAEVARALHHAWNQPGPDGGPLQLVHRDLKPSNLQITSSGEVKVLDFGLARARFATRETETQAFVGGTSGFVAPERVYGEDGPAGDVFSLGALLHLLLTAEVPARRESEENEATRPLSPSLMHLLHALELAKQMRDLDWQARPSAREVERACRDLAAKCPPPDLRDWAEERVPTTRRMARDALVGQVLVPEGRGGRTLLLGALALGGVALVAGGAALLGIAAVVALVLLL